MSMNFYDANTKRYQTYATFGLAGIVVSFALLLGTWRYMYGQRVLGVSTVQDGTSEPQQFNPQQPAQQIPSQQEGGTTGGTGSAGGQTIASPSSPTTEVTITNPTTEIIIQNTNTELVITDVGSQTEIVSVPAVPASGSTQQTSPSAPSQQVPVAGQASASTSTSPGTGTLASTPTVISTLPGITTKTYPSYATTGMTSGTAQVQPSAQSPTMLSTVSQTFAKPLSYIGIGTDAGSASVVPADAVTIQYTPAGQTTNLDKWLRDYQFQVWAVGSDTVAIYQRGITTYTTDAIKLGLSKLSFKLVTDSGELPVLYYPYTVWTHLSAIHEISEDTHDQPIRLISEGGTLRYFVHAHSRQFLLAAIPVSICRNIVVAVDTGDILDSRACSQFDSALDALSLRL